MLEALIWLIELALAGILIRLIYKRGKSAGREEGLAIGARWSEEVAHKAFHAGMMTRDLADAAARAEQAAKTPPTQIKILRDEFVEQQRRASRGGEQ